MISAAQNLFLLQHPQDCAFSTQQSPPGALPQLMEVCGADPALCNLRVERDVSEIRGQPDGRQAWGKKPSRKAWRTRWIHVSEGLG